MHIVIIPGNPGLQPWVQSAPAAGFSQIFLSFAAIVCINHGPTIVVSRLMIYYSSSVTLFLPTFNLYPTPTFNA